jgi:hypothetical protein
MPSMSGRGDAFPSLVALAFTGRSLPEAVPELALPSTAVAKSSGGGGAPRGAATGSSASRKLPDMSATCLGGWRSVPVTAACRTGHAGEIQIRVCLVVLCLLLHPIVCRHNRTCKLDMYEFTVFTHYDGNHGGYMALTRWSLSQRLTAIR